MTHPARSINLLDLDLAGLRALAEKLGEKPYRGLQLLQWLHQHSVADIDQMSNLSKAFRAKLSEVAEVRLPEIAFEQAASDGTYKWLLRMHDGNAIETVYIPERDRGTLCVSSQVGCALNCSFCATGKEGFNRNLTLGEIIGQVWIASRKVKVTNVVMMGMGEPLLNYDAVLSAMDIMMSDHGYGLSKYRVTLSTSGVIPAMLKLQKDSPASLAVSLHAPNNALRNQLVPLNKKYPLEQLMPVCRDYFAGTKRKVTFEYVMLDGINDTVQHARELVKLIRDIPCKMNLIPFNPFPKTNYQTSSATAIDKFQRILVDAGINTRVRRTRGEDIDAACGQLAGSIQDRTGRHKRWQRTGRLIPIVEESV